MVYSIAFAAAAKRQFDKLPRPAQQQLGEVIAQLAGNGLALQVFTGGTCTRTGKSSPSPMTATWPTLTMQTGEGKGGGGGIGGSQVDGLIEAPQRRLQYMLPFMLRIASVPLSAVEGCHVPMWIATPLGVPETRKPRGG